MASSQHVNTSLGDRHGAHNWEYEDATARAAASGFVSSDLKKIALQLDNNTFWMLTAITPTWVQQTGTGAGSTGANPTATIGAIAVNGSATTFMRSDGAPPLAIASLTGKTTPADADTAVIADSAASSALKSLTWANIKATLKTYFDTLYQPTNSVLTALASVMSSTATAAAQRTALGLVINTDVQAHDTDLDTIAGLTATTDNFIQSKSSAWASRTPAQVAVDLQGTSSTTLAAGNDSRFTQIAGRSVGGTTDTIVVGDEGKFVEYTGGSACTVSLPQNSDQAIPVGSVIELRDMGTGGVIITNGTGATVNARIGLSSAGQYAVMRAVKTATNTWLVAGDLA